MPLPAGLSATPLGVYGDWCLYRDHEGGLYAVHDRAHDASIRGLVGPSHKAVELLQATWPGDDAWGVDWHAVGQALRDACLSLGQPDVETLPELRGILGSEFGEPPIILSRCMRLSSLHALGRA